MFGQSLNIFRNIEGKKNWWGIPALEKGVVCLLHSTCTCAWLCMHVCGTVLVENEKRCDYELDHFFAKLVDLRTGDDPDKLHVSVLLMDPEASQAHNSLRAHSLACSRLTTWSSTHSCMTLKPCTVIHWIFEIVQFCTNQIFCFDGNYVHP